MDRKYSCLQYIPLSAAILLDLATEHWSGAMDSGQYAETILKTIEKTRGQIPVYAYIRKNWDLTPVFS